MTKYFLSQKYPWHLLLIEKRVTIFPFIDVALGCHGLYGSCQVKINLAQGESHFSGPDSRKWLCPATTEEIDCTLKVRPHSPEICISKRRHPGKNFVKNYILLFKFYECNFPLSFFLNEVEAKLQVVSNGRWCQPYLKHGSNFAIS